MTGNTQPEALELASAAESADLAGYPTAKKANAYCLCLLEDCAHMIRKLHSENESLHAERERNLDSIQVSNEIINKKNAENAALQQGYAAARLEIESLRARSAAPAGEYPLLPEPVGKVEVSTTLENSGLRRHKASPAYTSDQRRAYVDRAMRAEQPAGARQPGAAYAALPGQEVPSYSDDALLMVRASELRAFADATHALRASHGQAPAQAAPAAIQCVECNSCGSVFEIDTYMAGYTEGKGHCLNCHGIDSAPTTQPAPRQEAQEPVAWRELCRRLYVELFYCNQQMTGGKRPKWQQGKNLRDVLADAKAALDAASQPTHTPQADSVLEDAASAGFFLQLPQRPKPEAPAGTVGLDWDAYSGAQMLAYGRDCSNAAIVATQKPGGL